MIYERIKDLETASNYDFKSNEKNYYNIFSPFRGKKTLISFRKKHSCYNCYENYLLKLIHSQRRNSSFFFFQKRYSEVKVLKHVISLIFIN